jgi:predicted membrane protein
MARPYISHKRSKIIGLILFIIALLILTLYGKWWPGIMLAVGLPLALYQYLQRRRYDMYITLFVFVGVFITVQFNIAWQVLLPVLFIIGGIYIFFREFFEIRESEAEKEEDLSEEIDEDRKD